jgi:hypothetical protein
MRNLRTRSPFIFLSCKVPIPYAHWTIFAPKGKTRRTKKSAKSNPFLSGISAGCIVAPIYRHRINYFLNYLFILWSRFFDLPSVSSFYLHSSQSSPRLTRHLFSFMQRRQHNKPLRFACCPRTRLLILFYWAETEITPYNKDIKIKMNQQSPLSPTSTVPNIS